MIPTTEIPRLLSDGRVPMAGIEFLAFLDEIGITHTTHRHEPLFTVEQSKAARDGMSGGFTKNLFLRNKKGSMWLVTCTEDRRLDLKGLAEVLGAGRLSFGSAQRLMTHLGVIPGAVTPFAVVNDHQGVVQMVLDRALLDLEPIHLHPLDNSMTTAVKSSDLLRFLDCTSHPPTLLDLDVLEV